jgi:nicotinamide riboside transporter PnuC
MPKEAIMKWAKTLGLLALGVWLIMSAFFSLLNLTFPLSNIALDVIALMAGVLLLLGAAE